MIGLKQIAGTLRAAGNAGREVVQNRAIELGVGRAVVGAGRAVEAIEPTAEEALVLARRAKYGMSNAPQVLNPGASRNLARSMTTARGGFESDLKIAATSPGIKASKAVGRAERAVGRAERALRDPVATADRLGTQAARKIKAKGAVGATRAMSAGETAHRLATKRGVGTAALVGLAGVSFAGGINQDGQVSKPLMQFATGTPDFTRYVLGSPIGDSYRLKNRRAKNPNPVDGKMVVGMYNSRMG